MDIAFHSGWQGLLYEWRRSATPYRRVSAADTITP
jgi:hypothetical protein